MQVPAEISAYYQAKRPLICEFGPQRCECQFWPFEELVRYNVEYEVPKYAPGYFGFGTDGGGEMYALASNGAVVNIPFIGMEPAAARLIARSWRDFEGMLRAL